MNDQPFRQGQPWRERSVEDKSLFLDEASSDVEIFVKSNIGKSRFPCHHLVLKKYMPTLPVAWDDNRRGVINIDNHEPETVEQVLRYIYQDHIHFDDWKTARDVLKFAVEHQIAGLIQECESFLVESRMLRNACYLLDLSIQYSLPKLKTECLKFCSVAAFIILQTKAFNEISQEAVSCLTGTNQISVENEMSIFNALWKWSKANCIRQSQQLTERDIIETSFRYVADCVGFEFMDGEEKDALPISIKEKYGARLYGKPSTDLKIKRSRYIKDVPLDRMSATVLFECVVPANNECIQGDNVSCVKFELNVDSYLLEVNTICLCEGRPKTEYVKKLNIVGSKDVEFSWDRSLNMVHFKDLGVKFHRASVFDADSMVAETQYRFVHMLLLRSGEYSIEIEPKEVNIKWPLTTAMVNRKKSDVTITLQSEPHGLRSLKFLQAC